jgi:hypothetical protein
MERIFLRNDYDVHRVDMRSRGVLLTGVFPRGFISATPDGAAIHASLEVVLTELAPGEFIGTIQGTALTTQLGPLLAAAELAGERLIVHDRVVVDTEDYDDYEPHQVERERRVRRAS